MLVIVIGSWRSEDAGFRSWDVGARNVSTFDQDLTALLLDWRRAPLWTGIPESETI